LHPQVIGIDDIRTAMLSNLTLEETVMADSLADDEIDYRNVRYSGLRPRRAASSAAEDDMMVLVVVAVVKVVEWVEFGDGRGQSLSDGICL
jgi:hypothetical protein